MITDYTARLKVVRADRAKDARRLRAAGLSVREIAAALGVSHPTVLNDLEAPDADDR